MRTRTSWAILSATSLAAVLFVISQLGWGLSLAGAQDSPPPPPVPGAADDAPAPQGAEVQVRGPVHEAYASPVDPNPQPGPIVPKKPPEPIEEVAPDEQPEGDNVIWIPGYWAWDDERTDFLWISGLWRNMPPGQTWVPGYWTAVPGGFQWTSGFWTSAASGEVNYLTAAPPESLEEGPSSPAPSDNHFWIPGSWYYRETRYAWRPGYWAPYQPNWIWVPAHYIWCPSGYVFVDGYWDHVVEARGCLFAPVYFTSPIYVQPAFVYRPSVIFNVGFFSSNLFCRPAFSHYYVGDYYASSFVGLGFRPWFEINIGGHRHYDPFFAYYNCRLGRNNPKWLAEKKQHFDHLRDNAADRPPHTFKDQQEWMAKKGGDGNKRKAMLAAATIGDVGKLPSEVGVKFRKVSDEQRSESAKLTSQFNKVAHQREDLEKKTLIGTTDKTGSPESKGAARSAISSKKSLKLPTELTTKATAKSGVSTDARLRRSGLAQDSGGGDNTAPSVMRGVTGVDKGPAPTDAMKKALSKMGEADSAMQGGKKGDDPKKSARSVFGPSTGGADSAMQDGKKGDDVKKSSRSAFGPSLGAADESLKSDAAKRMMGSKSGKGGETPETAKSARSNLAPSLGAGGGDAPPTTKRSGADSSARSSLSQGGGSGMGALGGGSKSNDEPKMKKSTDLPSLKKGSDSSSSRSMRSLEPSGGSSKGNAPSLRAAPRLTPPPSGESDKKKEEKKKNKSAESQWPRTNFDFQPPRLVALESSTNKDDSQQSADKKISGDKSKAQISRAGGAKGPSGAFGEDAADGSQRGKLAVEPLSDNPGVPRLSQPKTLREIVRGDKDDKAKLTAKDAKSGDDQSSQSNQSKSQSATPRGLTGRYPIPSHTKSQNSTSGPSASAMPFNSAPQNAAEFQKRALDPRALGPGGQGKSYRALMEYGRSLSNPNLAAPSQTVKTNAAKTETPTADQDEGDQTKRKKDPITNFGLGSTSNRMRSSLDKSSPDLQYRSGSPGTPHSPGSLISPDAAIGGSRSPGSRLPAQTLNKERPYQRAFDERNKDPFPSILPGR